MIVEKISFSAVELNTGVDVVKSIANVTTVAYIEPNIQSTHVKYRIYRPVRIIVTNSSGVAVNFVFFSDEEYAKYLVTPTISNKITVASAATIEFYPTMDKVTKIVALGTTGHTSTFDITVIKE